MLHHRWSRHSIYTAALLCGSLGHSTFQVLASTSGCEQDGQAASGLTSESWQLREENKGEGECVFFLSLFRSKETWPRSPKKTLSYHLPISKAITGKGNGIPRLLQFKPGAKLGVLRSQGYLIGYNPNVTSRAKRYLWFLHLSYYTSQNSLASLAH